MIFWLQALCVFWHMEDWKGTIPGSRKFASIVHECFKVFSHAYSMMVRSSRDGRWSATVYCNFGHVDELYFWRYVLKSTIHGFSSTNKNAQYQSDHTARCLKAKTLATLWRAKAGCWATHGGGVELPVAKHDYTLLLGNCNMFLLQLHAWVWENTQPTTILQWKVTKSAFGMPPSLFSAALQSIISSGPSNQVTAGIKFIQVLCGWLWFWICFMILLYVNMLITLFSDTFGVFTNCDLRVSRCTCCHT